MQYVKTVNTWIVWFVLTCSTSLFTYNLFENYCLLGGYLCILHILQKVEWTFYYFFFLWFDSALYILLLIDIRFFGWKAHFILWIFRYSFNLSLHLLCDLLGPLSTTDYKLRQKYIRYFILIHIMKSYKVLHAYQKRFTFYTRKIIMTVIYDVLTNILITRTRDVL